MVYKFTTLITESYCIRVPLDLTSHHFWTVLCKRFYDLINMNNVFLTTLDRTMVSFSQLQTRQWCFHHNCRQDNGVFPSTLDKTMVFFSQHQTRQWCFLTTVDKTMVFFSQFQTRQWCFSRNFRQDNRILPSNICMVLFVFVS